MKKSQVLRSRIRFEYNRFYFVSFNDDRTITVTNNIDKARSFTSFWKALVFLMRYRADGFEIVKW